MNKMISQLTGDSQIDKVIKEISTETCFDFELAKHFYLKTGDKDFCVELSRLHGRGYSSIALELLADAFAEKRAKEHMEILRREHT